MKPFYLAASLFLSGMIIIFVMGLIKPKKQMPNQILRVNVTFKSCFKFSPHVYESIYGNRCSDTIIKVTDTTKYIKLPYKFFKHIKNEKR